MSADAQLVPESEQATDADVREAIPQLDDSEDDNR
ncbi:hypothetical protein Htur_5086 (plasmid) [Haloterrigena turkmenica DSM 5511]|uniref:Uncharacterized protein n=1 Tax=Haloterrigena turkmenica (strain ATCC 51198 / DSM 5511 / JCM 9101 / NCIMB 13204 / VKM B-1734 / 4k) TaxID=543526 RepID=D2S3M6_HALTV|nr:hypothetical protein Htur_5086 [Haloterrigena turkmenica DSM 5511]